MQHKCLLGSKMLKLNNRDEDWVTFIDECARDAMSKNCQSIPFYKGITECFIKGGHIYSDPYNALFIYQISVGFHDEEYYPFGDFNILEHKDVWIKWLKAYMNDEAVEQKAMSQDILRKQFYNILYQYHMIIEDTHFISDEAKVDVQKIHDFEMPSSYFYELRDKINSL